MIKRLTSDAYHSQKCQISATTFEGNRYNQLNSSLLIIAFLRFLCNCRSNFLNKRMVFLIETQIFFNWEWLVFLYIVSCSLNWLKRCTLYLQSDMVTNDFQTLRSATYASWTITKNLTEMNVQFYLHRWCAETETYRNKTRRDSLKSQKGWDNQMNVMISNFG